MKLPLGLALAAALAPSAAALGGPAAPADEALALREAAKRGPLDRQRALRLADVELAAGNPVLAEQQLRSVLARFESVAAWVRLARLQSRQRDAGPALESLRRARELAPNSEDVLGLYGQIALASGAPVPAILALQPLTRMCPSVAEYRYLLGVALMQVGDTAVAVEVLQEAERLEPDRPLTLLALGLVLNHRKLFAEAKPRLLQSLERAPDNLDAVAALAEAEDGLGELEAAEQHAGRALARDPANATANLVIGLVRMKQDRYAEARAALERAVAAEPASAKVHYQLSLACARLHDEPASQKHLELYRQMLKEIEERVNKLRAQTGFAGAGPGS